MKLALLSLPFDNNFGQFVQYLALKSKLEELGHDVTVVDHKTYYHINWKRYPLALLKRAFKRMRDGQTEVFFEQKANARLRILNAKKLEAYHKFFDKIKTIDSFEKDFKQDEFDGYVVGSDQVWRPGYFEWDYETVMSNAFLAFTKGWNVKRVAYAPSFGTDEWLYTRKQTDDCKLCVREFDGVSVREQSAVRVVKEHLDAEAIWVLDPTMLHDKSFYQSLIGGAEVKQPHSLMSYILDKEESKMKVVKNVCHTLRLKENDVLAAYENPDLSEDERLMPPILEWLQGFNDAEFVVTDSFHGTVFAIIFNKPFITIANQERGLARFESLLGLFGLQDRLYTGDGNLNTAQIDWTPVNEKVKEMQELSLDFLRKSLS